MDLLSGKSQKGEGAHFWGVANRQCAGEEEPENSRERSSSFSLRSTEIEPTVFVEARGKVHLRDESYAWASKSGVSSNFKR